MTPCDGSLGVTRAHLCSRNEDQHLCSWGLPAVSEGGKNIWCPGGEGRSQGSTVWLQGTGICGMKEGRVQVFSLGLSGEKAPFPRGLSYGVGIP